MPSFDFSSTLGLATHSGDTTTKATRLPDNNLKRTISGLVDYLYLSLLISFPFFFTCCSKTFIFIKWTNLIFLFKKKLIIVVKIIVHNY